MAGLRAASRELRLESLLARLIRRRCARRRGAARRGGRSAAAAVLLAALVAASPSGAQALYKYRDANGVWTYTDRRPAVAEFETLALERAEEPAGVRLYQRALEDGTVVLVAANGFYGPVQIAFELATTENLAADVPTRGNRILEARSETDLLTLRRADPSAEMSVEYRMQFIPGSPGADHSPERPYRLPFALASGYRVSQAYPDTPTHGDAGSRHAIDFVMPVGTGVYAAREGTVIEVAGDYFESGLDPATDGPRANIVRILHSDGTMALYAHLNWNSIRVAPGQHVARGEYLADSGNTGYTTGPHLHFVVQRNAGGQIVSLPVEFAGPGASTVTLVTGDLATAY